MTRIQTISNPIKERTKTRSMMTSTSRRKKVTAMMKSTWKPTKNGKNRIQTKTTDYLMMKRNSMMRKALKTN